VTDALGDSDRGAAICREAIEALERCGDRAGLAAALVNAGEIRRGHGDNASAADLYERALTLFREAGDRTGTLVAMTNLGMALVAQGDALRAEACLRETLSLIDGTGLFVLVPVCLVGLARVAATRGHSLRAARLIGASQGLCATVGIHLHPVDEAFREQTLLQLNVQLDSETTNAEMTTGGAMSLDESIRFGRDSNVSLAV
jgi:hypothetical protein